MLEVENSGVRLGAKTSLRRAWARLVTCASVSQRTWPSPPVALKDTVSKYPS